MHTYSTDNDLRPKVYFVLALVAYGLTVVADIVVTELGEIFPFHLGVGISLGIAFAIVWQVHDKWFWKTRLARFLRMTKVPNLDGEWEGWIVTSYEGEIDDDALHPDNDSDEEGQKMKATLDIDQTWRKINVRFETTQTTSDSNGATILTDEGKWPSLSYQYENPGTPLIDGVDMHFGTASLEHRDDGDVDTLKGIYYTGPGRDNHGLMNFERTD